MIFVIHITSFLSRLLTKANHIRTYNDRKVPLPNFKAVVQTQAVNALATYP